MAPKAKLIDLELDDAKIDLASIQAAPVVITDSLNNKYTFVTFYTTAAACLLEDYMDEHAAKQAPVANAPQRA
jgi:hypothetical protein